MSEGKIRLYVDGHGDFWLDPGSGRVLALDEPVARRMRQAWPDRDKDEIAGEFGGLTELSPKRESE